MAIAFFTVYRVYNWEFNSKKEIKVILPTWDGPFLNPLIYYMNNAKKFTEISVEQYRHMTVFWVSVRYKKPSVATPKGQQYAVRSEVLC